MKTIAVIPARGGSKRIPGKNIIAFDDMPLIAHSILFALSNKEVIDECYVSTDDEEIRAVAVQYGATVILRPLDISGDTEPTVSAIQHILKQVKADNVVVLQPTNPLRPKDILHEAYAAYLQNQCSSLFTLSPLKHKVMEIRGTSFTSVNYTIGQRSQDMHPLYYENGLLYISSADTIRNGKVISDDGYPFITNHIYGTVDIDTFEDLAYAKFIMEKYKNQ